MANDRATTREQMVQALNDGLGLLLREHGFTGSFPHFRRRLDDRVDLLSVQFFSSGGSFVIEVASCPADGVRHPWGRHIPANKVKATDVNQMRPRLGSPTFPHGDHWFDFGPRSYESPSEHRARTGNKDPVDPTVVTEDVVVAVEQQAMSYWEVAPGLR